MSLEASWGLPFGHRSLGWSRVLMVLCSARLTWTQLLLGKYPLETHPVILWAGQAWLPRVDSLMFIKVILCLCLSGILNMLLLSLIYLPIAYSYLKQFQIH